MGRPKKKPARAEPREHTAPRVPIGDTPPAVNPAPTIPARPVEQAPMQPASLPPNPGPTNAELAASVSAQHDAPALDDETPPAPAPQLSGEAVVELADEVSKVACGVILERKKIPTSDARVRAMMSFTPEQKAKLLPFANAAAPRLQELLFVSPNAALYVFAVVLGLQVIANAKRVHEFAKALEAARPQPAPAPAQPVTAAPVVLQTETAAPNASAAPMAGEWGTTG